MRMLAEEIRQDFEAAGWDVGGPVGEEEAERLEMAVRGEAGKYTITAHRSVLVLDDPVLELCDRDRSRVARVRRSRRPNGPLSYSPGMRSRRTRWTRWIRRLPRSTRGTGGRESVTYGRMILRLDWDG